MLFSRNIGLSLALLALMPLVSCTTTGDDPSDNQANANQPADNDPAENRPAENGNDNEGSLNDNTGEPASVPPTLSVTDARLEADPGGGYIVYITIQPTEDEPDEGAPYDPDSETHVYVLLDINDDPEDDSLDDIDFVRTALLDEYIVAEGEFAAREISASAEPTVLFENPTYPLHVRVSITDGVNPPVHVYAPIQIEE
jgi:hypothetical protein